MKNRQILRALSLLAAVCIAAGCNQSASEEAAATTVPQTNSAAVTETEETTVSEDPDISEPTELEVDYVDEDGIVYYKNPTEWTYEKFFSELTINGESIEAPLTLEKMGEGFTIDENTIGIDEEQRLCVAQILYDGKLFAQARFKDVDNVNDLAKKEIDVFFQLFFSHTDEECFEVLKLNNIGMGSNKDDIKSVLGIPYGEADYILIFDNNKFSFQFNENGNIDLVLINFEAMKKEGF